MFNGGGGKANDGFQLTLFGGKCIKNSYGICIEHYYIMIFVFKQYAIFRPSP